MLKIQFKRKKGDAAAQSSQHPVSGNQQASSLFAQEFGQANAPAHTPGAPVSQEDDSCLFCGSEITGAHLSVIIKKEEHRIHPSCIVSGFALLANGVGLLFSWLKERKK